MMKCSKNSGQRQREGTPKDRLCVCVCASMYVCVKGDFFGNMYKK